METYAFDIDVKKDGRTLVDIGDFRLRKNTVTFLFGESGIGKSIAAKAMFGLLDPQDLDATVNAEPYADYVAKPRTVRFQQNGCFVFQEPSSHLNPLLRLEEQLTEGSLARAKTGGEVVRSLWKDSDAAAIRQILEVFPKPYRPSGGEKQRILCAMAFMKMDMLPEGTPAEDALFVFDEPTGSLDNTYRDVVLEMMFERFRRSRCTIVMITHDYSMISVVTGKYPEMLDSVVFEELTLGRGGLQLAEFAPRTYTGWVEEQRKSRQGGGRREEREPVLRIESGLQAFGRTLHFSREPGGRTHCALELFPESISYLKGASGMGKTTVVKMAIGLLRGAHFRGLLGSVPLTERTPREYYARHVWGKRMTMVFQHADEALNLRSTVHEVLSGLPTTRTLEKERIQREVRALFGESADGAFLDRKVGTLSGGQKQRLNLLRGLLLETDVIILDEPLNGLDFASMRGVLHRLEGKIRRGSAILVISHNEEIFDAWVAPENVYYLSGGPAGVSPLA